MGNVQIDMHKLYFNGRGERERVTGTNIITNNKMDMVGNLQNHLQHRFAQFIIIDKFFKFNEIRILKNLC